MIIMVIAIIIRVIVSTMTPTKTIRVFIIAVGSSQDFMKSFFK
jgi:hypothetical protein